MNLILQPEDGGTEVVIGGHSRGIGGAPASPDSTLMCTYKIGYGWDVSRLAVLALLLAGSPCFGQSTTAGQPAVEASASAGDMFSRVIANQKRVDADLNVYERVERVEIRKTGSDPKPS